MQSLSCGMELAAGPSQVSGASLLGWEAALVP